MTRVQSLQRVRVSTLKPRRRSMPLWDATNDARIVYESSWAAFASSGKCHDCGLIAGQYSKAHSHRSAGRLQPMKDVATKCRPAAASTQHVLDVLLSYLPRIAASLRSVRSGGTLILAETILASHEYPLSHQCNKWHETTLSRRRMCCSCCPSVAAAGSYIYSVVKS